MREQKNLILIFNNNHLFVVLITLTQSIKRDTDRCLAIVTEDVCVLILEHSVKHDLPVHKVRIVTPQDDHTIAFLEKFSSSCVAHFIHRLWACLSSSTVSNTTS